MTAVSPKRSYFLRAFHEWLEDNDFTAYLMIDATHPDLVAPLQYAQDGRLVLAASYRATNGLLIDNDSVSFAARFGGVSEDLWIPMAAVMGIYAKENPEHALFFDPQEYADMANTVTDDDDESVSKPSTSEKKGGLRLLD